MDKTNAERQRRYIQRLKAGGGGVTNAGLEQANARIRDLEAELGKATESIAALKAHLRLAMQAEADLRRERLERVAQAQVSRDEVSRRAAKKRNPHCRRMKSATE